MEAFDAATLALGGLAAGIVNTLAGGGSLLTVPLLVFLGLPGTLANGTNRIGVLVQNVVATWRFRAQGVSGLRQAGSVLVPVVVGSAVGAAWVSSLAHETFERLFGVLMLALLVPMLRGSRARQAAARPWSAPTRLLAFFGIGLYGGAFQAGVGLLLVFALKRAGHDWILSNSIKVVVVGTLTAIAVPVFVLQDQVAWAPALVLAGGFAIGGELGARLTVSRGEALIKPVLGAAVIAMAGRMFGLY